MAKSLVTLAAIISCLAVVSTPRNGAEPALAVDANAFPKAQQPQVAVDPTGRVYLVFGEDNVVHCTSSEDGAKSFAKPVKVGDFGSLALGMRRGPRVVATETAIVVTAIGGAIGRGKDENLVAWRSDDRGKSWQGPVQVNSVVASAREGLHHTTVAPDGTVYAVWLDLRAKKTQVFGAASTDGGATWHDEKVIYQSPDGGVCECCQPQAAFDPQGTLHVMWRNHLLGNRDMYYCSSKDHGKTFTNAVKLGQGTWPLNACPMDGGALAGNAHGQVMTIWMRNQELFRCEAGMPETSLGKGQQGWVSAGPGGFYSAWLAARPGPVLALVPGSTSPIKVADQGWDPVLSGPANAKGPIVLAWEEGKLGAKRIMASVLTPQK